MADSRVAYFGVVCNYVQLPTVLRRVLNLINSYFHWQCLHRYQVEVATGVKCIIRNTPADLGKRFVHKLRTVNSDMLHVRLSIDLSTVSEDMACLLVHGCSMVWNLFCKH